MADRPLVAFREADRTFQNLAAFTTDRGNLTGAGDPVVITVGQVTTEFIDALAEDDSVGRPHRLMRTILRLPSRLN